MENAGKARNNGLYRHIRTSKEIIRNLLNDSELNIKNRQIWSIHVCLFDFVMMIVLFKDMWK